MKIPKQLYVTGRDGLGFLHPHGTDKGAEKRRQTQMHWAYNEYSNAKYEFRESGLLWVTNTRWVYNGPGAIHENITTVKPADFQPAIWENEPLEGFTIKDTVSRWTTSNKLWLIHDPRGLDFEITTACMETILATTTVSKRKMLGKFIWVANKNLVCVEPV